MHALTDPIEVVRAAAMAHLRELETTLTAHGFTVEVEAKFWALTATNDADKLAPARSQRVQPAADHSGNLNWYWATPRSDDVELLCPSAAIAEATERIARALSLAGR